MVRKLGQRKRGAERIINANASNTENFRNRVKLTETRDMREIITAGRPRACRDGMGVKGEVRKIAKRVCPWISRTPLAHGQRSPHTLTLHEDKVGRAKKDQSRQGRGDKELDRK